MPQPIPSPTVMKLSFGDGAVLALASVWLLSWLAIGVSVDAWLIPDFSVPQLVMHDDATGNIFYSLCNSTGAPIFPADNSAAFDLKYSPLNGTGLAGFGYMEGDVAVVSSLPGYRIALFLLVLPTHHHIQSRPRCFIKLMGALL